MIKALKNKKKKGFTLIELIIVIAIIAILTAIAVPKFGQIQRNSKAKADIATAKNLHSVATQMLADGKITTGEVTADVADNVDGGTVGKTKLHDTDFVVNVTANGDVTVSASDGTNPVPIYPDSSSWK